MKVEEKANEYAIGKSSSGVFQKAHIDDFIAGAEWMKEQLVPETTLILTEGDWTKCDKFSEWVSLLEIEGCSVYFEDKYDAYEGVFKAFFNKEGNGGLNWGKGENFLPYQEFKNRAENTFKTK